MVDLTRFEELQRIQDEGRFFPIMDAAGNETDLRVKIAGPDSAAQRNAQHAIDAQIVNGRRVGVEASDEVFKAYGIQKLAAAVLGWENLQVRGEPLECTPENVSMMLSTYPVFQKQVAYYASERGLYNAAAIDQASDKEGND